MSTYRFAVDVMPRDGILDPQGRAVENALPQLGASSVHGVRVGRRIELTVEAEDRAQAREVVERLASDCPVEPVGRKLEHRGDGGRAGVKVGVVVFPGSNCDRDALHGARLAGADAELLWHEDTDLHGSDAVILPGGFAYGDYLRAGAIARFSPIMGAVRDHAARGGLVLGICNGFQVLTEAGLLPGALRRNATLRFEHRWVRLSVANHDTPFTRGIPHGIDVEAADCPRRGQLLPAGDRSRRARGSAGRLPSDTRHPRAIRTARCATSRASPTLPAESVASCRIPSERRRQSSGSDDGLMLLRSMVESAAQNARVEAAA